jgi:hypothetical protein
LTYLNASNLLWSRERKSAFTAGKASGALD